MHNLDIDNKPDIKENDHRTQSQTKCWSNIDLSQPRGHHIWKNESNVEKMTIKMRDKVGVLLVGVTGSGKSSIAHMMSSHNNKIKINHSTNSSSTIFDIYEANNYIYLDTRGTQHSANNQSTDQITKQIFQQCYANGINKMKIIFLVASDTTRMKNEFQYIVKFLLSIHRDIFNNSCMIIKKRYGDNNFDGIIASIKHIQFTSNSNNLTSDFSTLHQNSFGVNCIDMALHSYNNDTSILTYNILQKHLKDNRPELNKLGYYTQNEYKQLISRRLEKLDPVPVEFTIMKCVNCTEIGDKRFISSNCHDIKKYYHSTTMLQNRHSGRKQPKQIGTQITYCHANKTYKHSGKYEIIKISMKDPIKYCYHTSPLVDKKNKYCYDSLIKNSVIQNPKIKKIKLWTCCFKPDVDATGCYEFCVKCKQHYRSTKGCIQKETSKYIDICTNCQQKWDWYGCNSKLICCLCLQETKNLGCLTKCAHCQQTWGTTKCTQNIKLCY